jgi:hypothetical protein
MNHMYCNKFIHPIKLFNNAIHLRAHFPLPSPSRKVSTIINTTTINYAHGSSASPKIKIENCDTTIAETSGSSDLQK